MEQKKFITCGMQFGNEGKGSFIDYLACDQPNPCIVRYNGGSQGSHTVETPDGTKYIYSQLGSGMCNPNCYTFITSNMVINPIAILKEVKELANASDNVSAGNVLRRLRISGDCYVVTPYHKLLSMLKELSLGESSRGTVATGESEVFPLLKEINEKHPHVPLVIQFSDIIEHKKKMSMAIGDIKKYVSSFYDTHKEKIRAAKVKPLIKQQLEEMLKILESFETAKIINSYYQLSTGELNLSNCVYYDPLEFMKMQFSRIIFEGSQGGLLIDKDFGLHPNVTHVDAITDGADILVGYTSNLTKVGIAKAFTARHGKGIFPTFDEKLSSNIPPEDNNFWRGSTIRFGWFDCVLIRYAQSINDVDELYISSIDFLDTFEEIKICNSYIYSGKIDNKFKNLFSYYTDTDGIVYITSILKPSLELSYYLNQCTPLYFYLAGWNKNTTACKSFDELPIALKIYLKNIEELTKIKVTAISVGPTRENKIRIK